MINGSDYCQRSGDPDKNVPIIKEDIVFVCDCLPEYYLDNKLGKNPLLDKQLGKNMLVDTQTNPKDKIWIYDGYLYLDDNMNNIFAPVMDLTIEDFNENDKPSLSRKYKFVTFNHKPRLHRIIASSWINQNFDNNEYFYTAGFNVEQENLRDHLPFIDNLYEGLPMKMIGPDPNNGITKDIFVDIFYPYAKDSVFNIVNEVGFWEYGCHLSEKTFWALLSHNIPIVSGYAMATSMERIGFDMFTDIVDYTSEFIKDPFERTYRLLNDNKDVLKNAHNILTKDILKRLEYNKTLLLKPDISQIAINNLNTPDMVKKLKEILYNNITYMTKFYQGEHKVLIK